MEEIVRTLANSNITWSGAAIIIAIVMRQVFIALIDLAKTRVQATAHLERDRIDAEKDQTKILGELKSELVISRGINNQLITAVNAIPETIKAIGTRTDNKLERIHNDVNTIPAEIWRLGDPKLENIKAEFMRYVDSLQETIEDRIDPNALNAREAIRQEFAAITEQLRQIEEAVATLTRDDPDPDCPDPKTPKSAAPIEDLAA